MIIAHHSQAGQSIFTTRTSSLSFRHCHKRYRRRLNPNLAVKCQRAWSATNERIREAKVSKYLSTSARWIVRSEILYKNNAPTITNLCQVAKSSKEKNKTTILRAHRNVLQRLITAYETGAKMISTVC